MLPQTVITKQDGQTGVVKQGVEGNLVIIAPSEKGVANSPGAYTRPDLAFVDYGYGFLAEMAAYNMSVARKPTVLIKPTTTTAAAYSAFVAVGNGTSVIAAGGTPPFDDFEVILAFVLPGTQGVAGATYKYSLDNGDSYSGEIALGTATSIVIPGTNITITLGAGTFLANQTTTFTTTGAKMVDADLTASLEALRVSNLPWEWILVAGLDATQTTVSTLDLWLSQREAEGKFRGFTVNTRFKTQSTGETEAAYLTAMTTAYASATSIRGIVSADGGDLVQILRGIRQRRITGLGISSRLMAVDISEDAAFVGRGPIVGYTIGDKRGNPKFHDEALYPNLDGIRLATLRTMDQQEGVYVTNPLLISPSGSDYVYAQHARIMNKASEITFQLLQQRLSKGVQKNPKTAFILEEDAQDIDSLVTQSLLASLKGRVSAVQFTLSRSDDLSSNAGATVNGTLEVSALAYVKKWAINARFVRKIAVAA